MKRSREKSSSPGIAAPSSAVATSRTRIIPGSGHHVRKIMALSEIHREEAPSVKRGECW